MLGDLPGVTAKDGAVSLIGARSVTVMMDGKPSTLTMAQLQSLLENTPADRLERAEVIYNAPPSYHVNGAVINLAMKRPGSATVEGEFSANYNNTYYSDGGLNGNLRVGSSKSTLDVMYGASRKKTMGYSTLESLHTLAGTVYDISQTERISSKLWQHDVRAAYEYRFNDRNSVDVAYTGMFSPRIKGDSHTTGSFQESRNVKDSDTKLHNVALHVVTGIGLSAGLDYTHYSVDGDQQLHTDYADGTAGEVAATSSQTIDRYVAYVDQTHSMKSGWEIGYGASYSYSYDRDAQFYQTAEGVGDVQDTDSKLKEHKGDVYVSASKQLGAGISFDVSMKGEYYTIGGYKKWAVFPQFSLTWFKHPEHIVQLGLSTDKTYPKYWAMQASTSYIDGYSEMQGSPDLRPYADYSLNATYIFKQKYIFGLFYSYTDDFYAQSPYQAPDRLALVYKAQNWNYRQTAGVNVIVPVSVGGWFDSNIMLVGLYMHDRCDDFYDIGFNRKKLSFVGSMENSFRVNKHLLFELNGNVQAPAVQGTFDLSAMGSVDVGARWTFAKEKMSLSLFCNDLFNTSSPKLSVDYKGQRMENDLRYYTRSVAVKFVYKLNGFKSKENKAVDTSRFGH